MPDVRTAVATLQTDFADNVSGDISANDGRNVIVSCHPTNVVQTDTQANEPASGQLAGDLFLPSDGFQIERYSGSAWAPWGPIFPFTKPVSGDFAWINQDSAAISTTNGGIHLSIAAGASDGLRIRKKAAPTPPYTITAAFLLHLSPGAQFPHAGLCWRQSSDGKVVVARALWDMATGHISTTKYSSPTSAVANYVDIAAAGFNSFGLNFMRIADDNTNRILSMSGDGQNWVALHTVGRTDYLTADEVGFYVNPGNNYATGMTLLHWKEG